MIRLHKQLNLKDCCCITWADVKIQRAWRKALINIEDIQKKVADNNTTNVQEILSALCVISGCGDCDNTDVIK